MNFFIKNLFQKLFPKRRNKGEYVQFRGWHGSYANFDVFDLKFFGTGEKFASQGWGIYFSDNRDGGEYYAKMQHFRKGTGYLYEILLELYQEEYWAVEDKNLWQSSSGRTLSYIEYENHRALPPPDPESKALMLTKEGLKMFSLCEGSVNNKGLTFVVLDPSIIRIENKYLYTVSSGNGSYKKI